MADKSPVMSLTSKKGINEGKKKSLEKVLIRKKINHIMKKENITVEIKKTEKENQKDISSERLYS